MKDPFQTSLNSYEILDISVNASKEEIHQAFLRALAGRNQSQAKDARSKLISETDRALEDFLMYDADSIEACSQKNQFGEMLRSNRSSIAAEYKSIQTALFPEIGPVTHALALMWYWTAIREEEKCREKLAGNAASVLTNEISTLENAWRNTIAYFVALMDSDVYLERWFGKRAYIEKIKITEFISGLEKKVKSRIENSLQNCQDKYSSDNKLLSQVFSKLLDTYKLEINSAGRLKSLGIAIKTQRKGDIIIEGIGKIFIEEHGFSDLIRKNLSQTGLYGEKKKIADELLIVFSPYVQILEKINKKQYQAAIDEIDKFSKTEKSSPEVINLTCEALKGLLRYAIQNKNINELLQYIKKYFSPPVDSFKAIVKGLADEIDVLAREITDSRPDDAITILRWVHNSVPDHANIKLRLANVSLTFGIKKYLEGEKKYKANPTAESIAEMEAGFKYVEESLRLNRTDKAQEQHDIIRDNIELYKGRTLTPPKPAPPKPAPPKPKPPIPGKSDILTQNGEGVDILNECQNDYTKYIQTKTLIKELEKIKNNQGLNDKGKQMLKDSLATISALNDNLYNKIAVALEKFKAVCKAEPSNEIFRKNREIAEQMLSELQKPKMRATRGWFRPIIKVALVIAIAFLVYLIFWELKVNKSFF